MAIALPAGSTPPQTITAKPNPETGGFPIVYTRSQAITERAKQPEPEETEPWYPPGTEVTGYISSVYEEKKGEEHRSTVDIDVPLPPSSGPYVGPYAYDVWIGWRRISPAKPESRPIVCGEYESKEPEPGKSELIVYGGCGSASAEPIPVSDLKIAPAATPPPVYVGGKGKVPFNLAFGSTAAQIPAFSLKAATTLPGATAAVGNGVFNPGAIDPTSRLAPAASRKVNVTVPSTAKPGTYNVTLTATTQQGGATVGTGKILVARPQLKIGKIKKKPNGTAVLTVRVPSAGTLSAKGKGLLKAKRRPKGPGKLNLKLKANGGSKVELLASGTVKVKFQVIFKPTSGSPVAVNRQVTLHLVRR
jgi:hypothetical protein